MKKVKWTFSNMFMYSISKVEILGHPACRIVFVILFLFRKTGKRKPSFQAALEWRSFWGLPIYFPVSILPLNHSSCKYLFI